MNCLYIIHIYYVCIFSAVIGAVWEQRPQDISASVGSDVTLTCKVTGEPGYVTWNKNGNTIAVGTSIISSDNRISIPDATKYNLVITDLKRSDDDDYTCTVQNLPETQKSVTVHLTVLCKYLIQNCKIFLLKSRN